MTLIKLKISVSGGIAISHITQDTAYSGSCHAQRVLPLGRGTFVNTHHVLEHLTESSGHEVVQHGVHGRAEVEEHAREDVDILKHLKHLHTRELIHETPHEAIGVERRPTDPEHHHQHD